MDVNWETLTALKVNKFLTASFITQLIYDDDIMVPFDSDESGLIEAGEGIKSKVQFKEILGVGLSVKF